MDTEERYRRFVMTSSLAGVEPVVIDHARGATVTDERGHAYTDMYSGIAVVNTGHVHPRVAAAAKEQIDQLMQRVERISRSTATTTRSRARSAGSAASSRASGTASRARAAGSRAAGTTKRRATSSKRAAAGAKGDRANPQIQIVQHLPQMPHARSRQIFRT